MKIYKLCDPLDETYASAGVRGTWTESRGLCPRCTSSSQVIVPPIIIEWIRDGPTVGDFTWPVWAIVVSDRAGQALLRDFSGIELAPITNGEEGRLRTPRYPPGVQPLHELRVRVKVEPLPGSTVEVGVLCSECGNTSTFIDGIEQRPGDWDLRSMTMVTEARSRLPGQGLFVDEAKTVDLGIFGLAGSPRAVFCTQGVRDFILANGFTNCGFREVGETSLDD